MSAIGSGLFGGDRMVPLLASVAPQLVFEQFHDGAAHRVVPARSRTRPKCSICSAPCEPHAAPPCYVWLASFVRDMTEQEAGT
jgi:hypothetical protein